MGTFTRMALRTVVILCLVLISITLTHSSNRVNRNPAGRNPNMVGAVNMKIEARGVEKNYVLSKQAMTMKWICSRIYPMEMTMKWICSLIYQKEMTIKVVIKRSLL